MIPNKDIAVGGQIKDGIGDLADRDGGEDMPEGRFPPFEYYVRNRPDLGITST